MDTVSYPDRDIVREVLAEDVARPLVLMADEWDSLAVAPPTVIPELAKLFMTPSIFDE